MSLCDLCNQDDVLHRTWDGMWVCENCAENSDAEEDDHA